MNNLAHRARPLLGTLVEMAAPASPAAFERAFAAVEKVQLLMSYHDPASELSQLNRRAFREPVAVSPWTHDVLRSALEFAEQSGGAFDPTVAARLTALRFLPPTPGSPRADGRASWRDVDLLPRRRIRFRRALRLDLGGIAKGFAVDRAVDILRTSGCEEALVNAGGDLRAFGPRPWAVAIRHPAAPGLAACEFPLHEAALATSAGYFSLRRHAGRQVTALVDGRTRQPLDPRRSVSVTAPSALLADALTKVVFSLGAAAAPLLAQYAAAAQIQDPRGIEAIPSLSHAA